MTKKIIYFAIDEVNTHNESDAFLPSLKAERDSLSEILRSPKAKKTGLSVIVGGITVKWMDIAREIEEIGENLIIFHFAGHANSISLHLANKSVGELNVAYLLQSASKLKLVFLNGCSTKGHIDNLLNSRDDLAIIATYFPIPDLRAKAFAEQFYNSLISGKSIKEAFNYSISSETENPNDFHFRSIGLRENELKEDKDFWGLFSKKNESLDWKLS